MLLEGQLSIFEIETKDKDITDKQQQKIDEVIKRNTGTEIVTYKSGIVGVIADYDPKIIVPQRDITKAFKPSWTKQTYFISKEGEILAIAVGEVR